MNEHLPYDENLLFQYLDGTMSEEESREFEKPLRNNPALRERIQQLRIVVESVRQYGTRQEVTNIHEEMMPSLLEGILTVRMPTIRKIARYTMAAAACIILLILFIRIFSPAKTSASDLYNQAFVDYNASTIRGSHQSSALEEAYQKNNYTAVISQSTQSTLSEKDSLLTGISYLKTSQADQAIHWLSLLSGHGNFRQDAAFYLSMSYLKNKNYREAYSLMQQIHSNPSNVYHAQFTDEYLKKVQELEK
ncbi:MAG: anti-sigma factor family protein [Flavisolibacter sp.]